MYALFLQTFLLLSPAIDTTLTPFYFEPNLGQFDAQIRFVAHGAKYKAWITDSELLIEVPQRAPARIQFGRSQSTPLRVEGLDKQEGITNYFVGNDPKQWRTGIPAYSRVLLRDVYPGIDVVFYSTAQSREIEYDLLVRPGEDPSQISVIFEKSLKPHHSPSGEVSLDLGAAGKLRQVVPLVHQGGKPVRYSTRLEGNALRFEIGEYDRSQLLSIDPTIVWNTIIGQVSERIEPTAMTSDKAGALYVAGTCSCRGFESGTLSPENLSGIFVTKLGPEQANSSRSRIYTVVLGGEGLRSELVRGVAVDANGAAHIAGWINSKSFPVLNAIQRSAGTSNSTGFVAKLSGTFPFQLVYSTYAGGSAYSYLSGISIDTAGSAVVAGMTLSLDLTTRNPIQAANRSLSDAFVWVISANPTPGSGIYDLLFGTYFGGPSFHVAGVGTDAHGGLYVAGAANLAGGTAQFPLKAAFQTTPQGDITGFAFKLRRPENGQSVYTLAYSTYLGGAPTVPTAVAVGSEGSFYIVGETSASSTNFPIVNGIAPPGFNNFALKIGATPSGTPEVYPLEYSTRLPGAIIRPTAVAVDSAGAATVSLITDYTAFYSRFSPFYMLKLTSHPAGEAGSVIEYFTTLNKSGEGKVHVDSQNNTFAVLAVEGEQGQPSAYIAKLGSVLPSLTVTSFATTVPVFFQTAGVGCNAGSHTTPKEFYWPSGTICTITMQTTPRSPGWEYRFAKWSDNKSSNPTRTIQVGVGPLLLDTQFDSYSYVNVKSGSQNGIVQPIVDGYFKDGTRLTFTAIPNHGYGLARWQFISGSGRFDQDGLTLSGDVAGGIMGEAVFEKPAVRPAALQFVPLPPCRVLDTRTPLNGSYSIGTNHKLVSVEGKCSIPQDAVALSINLTAVPLRALGYLTVWSSEDPLTHVSLLNSLDGRVKANATIVPLGFLGRSFGLWSTEPTEAIVDVNGYFAAPSANSLAFYPLPPCRVLDTRLPAGSPALAAKSTRTIPVRSSNCNIPATAKAYSLNATVVPSGPLGYLTLWPTGTNQPVVSTLNALTGTVVANAAIVPAGTNGSIDVYATDRTDLVLDINGYFAPPGQAGALNFRTISPCRVLDTRNANGPLGGPGLQSGVEREFSIPSSDCGIPANAKAYSLNATVVPSGIFGYLSLWPSGSTQPVVSTLNAVDGAITSNAAIVPAGANGSVRIFPSNAGHLLFDINGYFVP